MGRPRLYTCPSSLNLDFMTSSPLVSIYIPTKNRPISLHRAILSIQLQTYKNIELIVVDDYSAECVELPKGFTLPAKVLRHPSGPLGAAKARNYAIRNANGDFVLGLDDDDFMYEFRVQQFIDYWYANHLDREFCSGLFTNCDGALVETLREPSLHELIKGNVVGNQVFTKRQYLEDIGFYNEQLIFWQDWDLWQRLVAAHGPLRRLNTSSQYVTQSQPNRRSITSQIYPISAVTANIARFCEDKYYITNRNKAMYRYQALTKHKSSLKNSLMLASRLLLQFSICSALKTIYKYFRRR